MTGYAAILLFTSIILICSCIPLQEAVRAPLLMEAARAKRLLLPPPPHPLHVSLLLSHCQSTMNTTCGHVLIVLELSMKTTTGHGSFLASKV